MKQKTNLVKKEELLKAGKGAFFQKSNIVDAYKLIPDAIRLFGFRWLNIYFYDKTKVFGIKEGPASFNSLPETIVNIICTLYKIPKSNGGSNLTKTFTTAYKNVCESLNIPLAHNCEKQEKVFDPST